jgi:hypothetical protein
MAYSGHAIRWSASEIKLLAKKCLDMQVKAPDVAVLELVRIAQRSLPTNRQRPLYASHHIFRIEQMMHEIAAEARRPAPEPASAPKVAHVDSPPGLLSNTDTFAKELAKVVAQLALKELVPELVAQVEHAVERAVVRANGVKIDSFSHLAAPTPSTYTKPPVSAPVEAKKPKKRVLILGLLPEQQQYVMREYGNELDLRFLKGQDGVPIPNVRNNAREADFVIGMNKFIRHGDEHAAKQVAKAYMTLYGGISGLRDVLDDIALGVDPRVKVAENHAHVAQK